MNKKSLYVTLFTREVCLKIANDIMDSKESKISMKYSSDVALVCQDPLYFLPDYLFGGEWKVTEIHSNSGNYTIRDIIRDVTWNVPPYFIKFMRLLDSEDNFLEDLQMEQREQM